MAERTTNTKARREQLRTVQICVALGLVIGIVFIIAGWLLKGDTGTTAHLPTTPHPSETTGIGAKD